MIGILIWSIVVCAALWALFIWYAAYRLHMDNDRTLGLCAFHGWLRSKAGREKSNGT